MMFPVQNRQYQDIKASQASGCTLQNALVYNEGAKVAYSNEQFQKISLLPPWRGFCFALPLPPGNSSLFSYISSKNSAFKTPLPLGFSNDHPWGGYGFFLEPHNITLSSFAYISSFAYLQKTETIINKLLFFFRDRGSAVKCMPHSCGFTSKFT